VLGHSLAASKTRECTKPNLISLSVLPETILTKWVCGVNKVGIYSSAFKVSGVGTYPLN
jgi:hypothetical protein